MSNMTTERERELSELVSEAFDRFTDPDFVPPNHELKVWLERAIKALYTGATEVAPKRLGKKKFNVTSNAGKAKYIVNYHDGEKIYSDGSDFYDMKIFNNRKRLAKFVDDLRQNGYSDK